MNRKKLLFIGCLFVLLVHSGGVFSQELQMLEKLGLGINGLDLSVEIPVAKKITIEPSVGFGPSYSFYGDGALTANMGWTLYLIEPSVHLGLNSKLFYNREKRQRKGKSIQLNSGHFFGLKAKYVSKPLTNGLHAENNVLLANLNWGGQHNMGRHWHYSYSVGVGYGRNLDFSWGTFYPAFDFKFAYILPLRKGK